MTAPRPKGRRLDPFEAFEVTPWRALIVFRLAPKRVMRSEMAPR